MNDHVVFLKEFITSFEETGSAIPSSRWAAQAMTNSLRRTSQPQSILEVGPGTGSVTTRILGDMVDGDHLTICEINSRFMNALKKKVSKDENYIRHAKRIEFFEGPIQALPEARKYDIIICAIPFNNLQVHIVEEIFAKLENLSSPQTHITFFEYMGLRRIGQIVSIKERRERLAQIEKFFGQLFATKYDKEMERVWLNFTPIKVYTLKPKLAA